MVSRHSWSPQAGEIVWVNFTPQAGHEQAGLRPALVISASKFNNRGSLICVCPITTKTKANPFEVELPAGLKTKGYVLADQFRVIDWKQRKAKPAEPAPDTVLEHVRRNVGLILELV